MKFEVFGCFVIEKTPEGYQNRGFQISDFIYYVKNNRKKCLKNLNFYKKNYKAETHKTVNLLFRKNCGIKLGILSTFPT